MTTEEKVIAVKNARNMVEVDYLICSITGDYLNRYANEVEKAPNVTGNQGFWVNKAVTFFIEEIKADKAKLWKAIPARFHKSEMYKTLCRIQFDYVK